MGQWVPVDVLPEIHPSNTSSFVWLWDGVVVGLGFYSLFRGWLWCDQTICAPLGWHELEPPARPKGFPGVTVEVIQLKKGGD